VIRHSRMACHRIRPAAAPCNVTRSSEIMTLNSPGGSTLQCGRWFWDDMPLNSPKRPPYWNSTPGFNSTTLAQSTCHPATASDILSKSNHPRQKKMTFSGWRISAILDFRDPIMGSLKSPGTTSYKLSIDTVSLNCFVLKKSTFFLHFGHRQTNRQTKRWTPSMH